MQKPHFEPMTVRLVALVAFTAVAAAIAATVAGIHVCGLWQPAAVVAALSILAWLRPAFRLCLSSLAILVAFSAAFAMLIYALGTSPSPLADPGLAMFDSLVGVDSHQIALATAGHPWFAKLMYLVYFSVLPETIFVLIWLGFRNDQRLTLFLYRFMICGLVTAACFYIVPAMGTKTKVNLPVINDLLALRSGALRTVSLESIKGIVTFPSFHAIWAILLILALPKPPIILLNVLMIASTVTTGGHYAIDVVGGMLVCAIVVLITNRQLAGFKLESRPVSELAGA